jgi:hypothetical protein
MSKEINEINEISESDYKNLDLPTLFEDKLTDRKFGLFSKGESKYKFGWQSETIKPNIIFINNSCCSIGVDLIFIIFEIRTGKVLVKIPLDYYYFDTKIYNNFLYVITELEIIKISIDGLKVIDTYSLPDYFESIEFYNDKIIVKCVNDEVIKM